MNGDIFTAASGVAVAMLEFLDKYNGAGTPGAMQGKCQRHW